MTTIRNTNKCNWIKNTMEKT